MMTTAAAFFTVGLGIALIAAFIVVAIYYVINPSSPGAPDGKVGWIMLFGVMGGFCIGAGGWLVLGGVRGYRTDARPHWERLRQLRDITAASPYDK